MAEKLTKAQLVANLRDMKDTHIRSANEATLKAEVLTMVIWMIEDNLV